jgi:hypothetical protein
MLELETIVGGSVVVAKAMQQSAQQPAMAANFALRIPPRFNQPTIFLTPGTFSPKVEGCSGAGAHIECSISNACGAADCNP